MTGLFDASDPDDLRHVIEQERDSQLAYATTLVSLVEQGDDPVMAMLAASFRAAGVREKRLRNALRIAMAG